MEAEAKAEEGQTLFGYVKDRTFTLATLGGGFLGTQAYITGRMSFPLALYYFSFSATISSASFFAIAYGAGKLSNLALGESDDIFNHAVSGGLLLAQYASLRYGRRAIPSRLLLGAGCGAAYHYVTSEIYKASRANWIEYRINPSGRPEVWRNPAPKHGDLMHGTRNLDPLRSTFNDLYNPNDAQSSSKKASK